VVVKSESRCRTVVRAGAPKGDAAAGIIASDSDAHHLPSATVVTEMTVREVVILLMTDMENAIGGQCHVAATTTSTAEENVISETSTGQRVGLLVCSSF
jgi:hypothetical protein